MPFLLYSYLISEMAAPFLASLAILTAVLFLGRLLQTFALVFALGIGWTDFLRLTLYLLPKLMMFSLPLASMLGVILAFNRLGADNEFLALRAAGVKLRQIVTPVVIFATVVMVCAGYSTTVLMPKGLVNIEILMLKLAREKIDRGLQEQSFSESMAGIVAYVDQIDRATGEWQTVYLYDGRKPKRPMTITAKSARLTADYDNLLLGMHLNDGAIDYLDHELSQHIDFKTYVLNLPVVVPEGVAGGQNNPTEMSQSRLLAEARKLGDSERSRKLLIEYHQRLILAVGCFILTLLGLPFAARFRPGARQIAVPVGLGSFLIYYILFSFAETLAEQGGGLPLPLTLWAPNFLFLALTAFVVLRMDKETLVPAPASLMVFFDRLLRLIARRRGGR
ncbi:MAG: LptF/LptG family permease [Desulfobulbaceae bacterium]|nr:LptF/LptG family permease [Desulfobulbaceae bacterium]